MKNEYLKLVESVLLLETPLEALLNNSDFVNSIITELSTGTLKPYITNGISSAVANSNLNLTVFIKDRQDFRTSLSAAKKNNQIIVSNLKATKLSAYYVKLSKDIFAKIKNRPDIKPLYENEESDVQNQNIINIIEVIEALIIINDAVISKTLGEFIIAPQKDNPLSQTKTDDANSKKSLIYSVLNRAV